MKHYIANILFSVLALFGIIIGSAGSELIKSITGVFIPPIVTLIIGLMIAFYGSCELIARNTDNFEIYENDESNTFSL